MTETFYRGFKAAAERLAKEVREELGLTTIAAFDPRALADHLAIPIRTLTDLAEAGAPSASIRHFLTTAPEDFSAMTVFRGSSRLIVVNPRHSPGRRANSLSHELSHVLLEHEAGPALDDLGCRQWSAKQEHEADWLGGVLLVPRGAALLILRTGLSTTDACERYGVSRKLLDWRVNKSGARKQFNRARAARRTTK